jgi:hypothetical protein
VLRGGLSLRSGSREAAFLVHSLKQNHVVKGRTSLTCVSAIKNLMVEHALNNKRMSGLIFSTSILLYFSPYIVKYGNKYFTLVSAFENLETK